MAKICDPRSALSTIFEVAFSTANVDSTLRGSQISLKFLQVAQQKYV